MGADQKKQQQKQEPKPGEQDAESEAREARKRLEEQNRAKGEKEPESGEKKPTDPAKRMPNGEPKEPGANEQERRDGVPVWFTTLPPEIRDAFSGGRYEDIPSRYRHLIERYNLWIQKHGRSAR